MGKVQIMMSLNPICNCLSSRLYCLRKKVETSEMHKQRKLNLTLSIKTFLETRKSQIIRQD